MPDFLSVASNAQTSPGPIHSLYEDYLTIRDARERYFAANGFSEESYNVRWFKLMAGPIPIYLRNTKQRVRSVRLHDIHHVATEYETTWTGESEIAAWEIASSCRDHWAAWGMNISSLAIGLFIAPRAVYGAFVRGRHSANLYRGEFEESLLAERVGALRARLGLDRAAPAPTAADRAMFAVWSALSLAAGAAPVVAAAAAIVWLLR
jgi:hypothetical protein